MLLGPVQTAKTRSHNPVLRRARRWRDVPDDQRTNQESLSAMTNKRTSSAARQTQRDLLRRVEEFMVRYGLPMSGANLSLVCDGLSGRNPALREAMTKQELSSQPIDEAWLGQFQNDHNKRADQLGEMMGLMENTMNDFQMTARNAREATDAYRVAMDKQLNEPAMNKDNAQPKEGADHSAPNGTEDFAKLLGLSRAMLSQLKAIEEEMERNQQEAEALRKSLAKARREADADHLTGLPNRRAFERELLTAVEHAKKTDAPLSVAFCDIDHFKKVNDTHGHEAGDRVLTAIAKTLSKIASDSCFVARHGGEEFVLLFSGIDQIQACKKLEAARTELSQRRLMNRDSGKPFGRITFSGGVAQVDLAGDPRAALALADAALYRAKEEGRNQVYCS